MGRLETFTIDWDDLDADKFADENAKIRELIGKIGLDSEPVRGEVRDTAVQLVRRARERATRKGLMESFLEEFGLSNKEGLALMCLAEALLRVPDAETADQLIAEKIRSGNWGSHAGRADSWLVNASTWGLMLTGGVVKIDPEIRRDPAGFMRGLVTRLGEPVIRTAMMQAMRIMGEQFVLGRSIEAAIKRAQRISGERNTLYSYDMLGEAARTEADAKRYFDRYMHAIEAVGETREEGAPEDVHGISVKLSALYPRYEAEKEDEVFEVLYPRLKTIVEAAARYDLNLCLDAEEVDRLVLQMKLLDKLAHEESLKDWQGLGLAVQAYQKRAYSVIQKLTELSKSSGKRFLVRLVKGAYWDTEIKLSQVAGMPDFPVWTTKPATDMSYLACARAMLDAPDAIYCQFATHNAHTLAAIREMAGDRAGEIEFQRLHGMGTPLYRAADDIYGPVKRRVYAPVGSHEDLLPYLVRRLLENGANTSFVHAFLDDDVPPETVASDPFENVENIARHPAIPTPLNIFGASRLNSAGMDLARKSERDDIAKAMEDFEPIAAGPIISGKASTKDGAAIFSPVDRSREIGTVLEGTEEDVNTAIEAAEKAQGLWDVMGGAGRAAVIRAMADKLEENTDRLMAIMSREGGKSLVDGIAEVREAVDFCRYYAGQAEEYFNTPTRLPGPTGETNEILLQGKGVFTCISPWNFPLAIFTGQVAAALAAGNAVLAKPAEQTTLIAYEATKLFHEAGVPADVLHLIPGEGGTVGPALTGDPRIAGVAFTGSTETARLINRTLAERDGPIGVLIAETGGLNGMFVDTTALREQVIDDVMMSAFYSAGQRCSALRVLFLPEDTADFMIEGIKGAMDALKLGDPSRTDVDIGPIIDEEARDVLEKHMERMGKEAKILKQVEIGDLHEQGTFFGPAMVELESMDQLDREVFGPILHIVRYKPAKLEETARQLAAKNYGLTLGVHSRLQSFADTVRRLVPAGNVYVNRNMVGAVVGVQPFGGERLSGTGPKAGGPHYLPRFAAERVITVNITAQGGDPELLSLT